MKIPAIRAAMGSWIYYVTTLTFKQVNDFVSKIDDELHKSESLKDLIQRSISNNYISIKHYILNQPDLFFNSLVLAVYNDYPDWREIEVKYDDFETYRIGILDFPRDHKIFPLDGQHRVEGIKAALNDNPELGDQTISAIFVGHFNSPEGMIKSRRLFSTLNRYAKPVTMDDIIALDEDDSAAIVTRILVEEFQLFTGKRVTKSKNKAIPEGDKTSITSIITLYQCNLELLKIFRKKRKTDEPNAERDNKSINEYLKFRPNETEIKLFRNMCIQYWTSFSENIDDIKAYNLSINQKSALRNKNTGGNLLFRPVGLLPYVQATLQIHERKNHSFDTIHKRMNSIDFNLDMAPWKSTLWNSIEKTMIMGSQTLVKLLFLYMYGKGSIRKSELASLKEKYAGKLNLPEDKIDNAFVNIPILN